MKVAIKSEVDALPEGEWTDEMKAKFTVFDPISSSNQWEAAFMVG